MSAVDTIVPRTAATSLHRDICPQYMSLHVLKYKIAMNGVECNGGGNAYYKGADHQHCTACRMVE